MFLILIMIDVDIILHLQVIEPIFMLVLYDHITS